MPRTPLTNTSDMLDALSRLRELEDAENRGDEYDDFLDRFHAKDGDDLELMLLRDIADLAAQQAEHFGPPTLVIEAQLYAHVDPDEIDDQEIEAAVEAFADWYATGALFETVLKHWVRAIPGHPDNEGTTR